MTLTNVYDRLEVLYKDLRGKQDALESLAGCTEDRNLVLIFNATASSLHLSARMIETLMSDVEAHQPK